MYPGYSNLSDFFGYDGPVDFYNFIRNNKENIGIWSATSKAQNARDLFQLWKGRFTRFWTDSRKERMEVITFDRCLWDDVCAHVSLIRKTKDSYKLQGLQILEKISATCGQEVLESIENQTSGKESAAMTSSVTSASNDPVSPTTSTVPDIQVPRHDDRYQVDAADVSLPFFVFQTVAKNNHEDMNLEENVHHILAMSSILLVQDNRWHPDMTGIFGKELLKNLHTTCHKQFGVGAFATPFDKMLRDDIEDILKKMKNGTKTRWDAQIDLLNLARKSSKIQAKLIRSVATFVEKLPKQKLKETIMETELCHRFLDPFMSPLFDDPDHDILFRCGSITMQRPDGCLSELDGLYFDASLGFLEVKPGKLYGNKFSLSKDLVRLGMLSKNAIDSWHLRGCIAVQIIDHKATFFLTTLPADGLYLMVELCTINLPACLDDLVSYISQADDITSILDCYASWCVHAPSSELRFLEKRKRDTLSDAAFEDLIMSPKSTKRRCYSMH